MKKKIEKEILVKGSYIKILGRYKVELCKDSIGMVIQIKDNITEKILETLTFKDEELSQKEDTIKKYKIKYGFMTEFEVEAENKEEAEERALNRIYEADPQEPEIDIEEIK